MRHLWLACPLVQAALALDGVWSNPGGGSWSVSGNWAPASTPGGVSSQIGFADLDLLCHTTVMLNGARTAGTLRFGDTTPSHDWSLRKGVNGSLTLDVASGSPIIEVLNHSATVGVDLSGNKGLSKTGVGTLILSGNNTYTGSTVISAGTLRLTPPPSFPTNMQIMPMGDSITYGYNGFNAGYRGPLYGLLLPLAPTFQFVGTSTGNPGFLPAYQQHHEGHSSYAITNLSNNLDGYDNSIFLQYGGADRDPFGGYWITGGNGTGRAPCTPHIVTLMAGTNDLDEVPGMDDRLRTLLTKLTTLLPESRILVARITPVLPLPTETAQCNAHIDTVVNEFRSAGKLVFPVDLNTTFPANGLIADGVHPNNDGFSWMAMQWHEAIIGAFTPASGISGGLPSTTAVTIANEATLDLSGNQAAAGSVTTAGTLALGSGGDLNASNTVIQTTGKITGSGTLRGSVILNGNGFGYPGQSLTFPNSVILNGTLTPGTGSQIRFTGSLTNNGVCNIGPGAVSFEGDVINNGVMRFTDGATLQVSGTFVNNGTLDLLTGSQALPANMVNHGWIIDSSAMVLHSVDTADEQIRLRIDSYSGHIYQLQHTTTLAADSWTDVGEPQNGTTGVLLEFAQPINPSPGRDFFRIRVSP